MGRHTPLFGMSYNGGKNNGMTWYVSDWITKLVDEPEDPEETGDGNPEENVEAMEVHGQEPNPPAPISPACVHAGAPAHPTRSS